MPKDGDRVRVVLEGVARWHSYDRAFELGHDGKSNSIFPGADHVVSVEVLPPPEPEWKTGDVVQDARGHVYRRANGRRWHSFDGVSLNDAAVCRPLTRLVPEQTA